MDFFPIKKSLYFNLLTFSHMFHRCPWVLLYVISYKALLRFFHRYLLWLYYYSEYSNIVLNNIVRWLPCSVLNIHLSINIVNSIDIFGLNLSSREKCMLNVYKSFYQPVEYTNSHQQMANRCQDTNKAYRNSNIETALAFTFKTTWEKSPFN